MSATPVSVYATSADQSDPVESIELAWSSMQLGLRSKSEDWMEVTNPAQRRTL
jgi:hypothetical protein